MINYLKKHWRGELDLGLSYWVNNLFFSLITVILTLLLTIFASNTVHLSLVLFIFIVWYLFIFFIFTPWVLVGLWRSASKHIEKYHVYFWANVVRVLVVLGVIRTVMAFIDSAYPQMLGYYRLLVGKSEVPHYLLSLEKNNTVLNITGGINLGLTSDFKEYVKKYPTIQTIKLESVGGLTSEARGVAKIVHEHHFDTLVTGSCLSSCTYIFASGKKRTLSTHGRLGFHRPAFKGVSEEVTDRLTVKDKALLREMGIEKEFIERIFKTPNSDILEVSVKELKRVGMVTNVVDTSNKFWAKNREELATLLVYSGVKREILEHNMTTVMRILYGTTKEALPLSVDDVTRWDNIIIDENAFTYEYTVLENSKIENLEHFKKVMKQNIKKNFCNDLLSVYLLKNGVTITSLYRYELDKKLLLKTEVSNCSEVER